MKKYFNYILVIIFTMGSQALLYFLIKCFISDYNVITSVVNFPFIKYFIYFYDLWYPFILLCTFLVYKNDKKIFTSLIIAMLLAALFAQITFVAYPTILIRPEIEVNSITTWLVNITYKLDTPAVNCLPSMHCTYCFITSYFIIKSKNIDIKKRILIVAFSLTIVLATLFTRQHVIEDVLLAFIYSVIAILIASWDKTINIANKIINKFKTTN